MGTKFYSEQIDNYYKAVIKLLDKDKITPEDKRKVDKYIKTIRAIEHRRSTECLKMATNKVAFD